MYIYNNKSDIKWAYFGTMTAAQMKQDKIFYGIFENPTVLFDANDGLVYDYISLQSLIDKYANYDIKGNPDIDINDPESALTIIQERMKYYNIISNHDNLITLELSKDKLDKSEDNKNIISLYADGSLTNYTPAATYIGMLWANYIAFGREQFEAIPARYKDEVRYRLNNKIFN